MSVDRMLLGTASWLTALCGVWLLASSGADLHASRQAAAWPTVEGRITDVRTRKVHTGRFLARGSWTNTSYEYVVHAVAYRGSRVSFGSILPAEYEPASMEPGRRVTVHYDPRDPADAVLYPGGLLSPLVYGSMGAFFLAVSVVIRRLVVQAPPVRGGGRRKRRKG